MCCSIFSFFPFFFCFFFLFCGWAANQGSKSFPVFFHWACPASRLLYYLIRRFSIHFFLPKFLWVNPEKKKKEKVCGISRHYQTRGCFWGSDKSSSYPIKDRKCVWNMMIFFACGSAVRCGAVIRIPIFPPAFLIRRKEEEEEEKASGSL